MCGLKPSAFSRYFKKENGITFRDYLVSFRIKSACNLLKNPNASDLHLKLERMTCTVLFASILNTVNHTNLK